MSPTGSAVPEDGSRPRTADYWVAPLVVLFGLWVWSAFSAGGYLPGQWLPVSLALGLFGLVAAILIAYPRRPRQLSLAILTLFALYALWVAASVLWADSTTRAWLEAARSFGFLLVFALALVFLTDAKARKIFRYLLMAAALVLFAVCVWRLWSAEDISGLFINNRFSYPVSYPNNAAALFLVTFWPLMWLAAGREERALTRGVALGLATGLLGLAVMTQSRGAVWSLAITLVLTFVVSPIRLRTLFYLLVPALLMIYAFPQLNRYWLEGSGAVDGGVGARSLLVAAITAAFIGTIVPLLERWVRVSMKMKAIFGAVILVGVVAGGLYGSITLTRDVGGPFKWVSQTWHQFTTDEDVAEASIPGSGAESRLAVISSSGRVDIWRVAWLEFQSAPALGVGADNFVFGYDRLRERAPAKSQQAHSLELQVLGETGSVGGILAFGGTLLALGGLLWPRCTAGWRLARETWLRRRRTAEAPHANPRLCNPRWGNDPTAYGWEMALFVAVAYWMVHASVDWLWQMAGLSIPMLLLLAAGVAGVDARAGVMWPRWNRWLGTRSQAEQPAKEPRSHSGSVGPEIESGATEADGQAREEPLLPVRRAERYLSKQSRRRRREERRRGNAERLQPPGALSRVFRYLLLGLAVVVLVVSGLPYLSLQIQSSALGIAKTDGVRAVSRAKTALWFQPGDPAPFATQARIYSGAASDAATSGVPDRAGAVLDNLALSIHSYEDAIANEPADWALRYRAGVETFNLLLASQYATGRDPALDYATLVAMIPGLGDWSTLSGSGALEPQAEPGVAAGSLAKTTETRQIAEDLRALAPDELRRRAIELLEAAKERNPLASQVTDALDLAQRLEELGMI